MKFKVINTLKALFYLPCFPILFFFELSFIDANIDKVTTYAIYTLVPIALLTVLFIYLGKTQVKMTAMGLIKRIAYLALVIYPLNICVWLILTFGMNIILDDRADVLQYQGTVIDKRVSNGNVSLKTSKTYTIDVRDTNYADSISFDIQRKEFDGLEIGDEVSKVFYSGKFGIPWQYSSYDFLKWLTSNDY